MNSESFPTKPQNDEELAAVFMARALGHELEVFPITPGTPLNLEWRDAVPEWTLDGAKQCRYSWFFRIKR